MPTNFKILKADPGYYALDRTCWEKEDRIEAVKIPVIAWRIVLNGDYSELLPICVDELSDLWKEEILAPDGIVYRRGCEVWPSFEDFQSQLNKKKDPRAAHVQTTIMDRMSEVVSHE